MKIPQLMYYSITYRHITNCGGRCECIADWVVIRSTSAIELSAIAQCKLLITPTTGQNNLIRVRGPINCELDIDGSIVGAWIGNPSINWIFTRWSGGCLQYSIEMSASHNDTYEEINCVIGDLPEGIAKSHCWHHYYTLDYWLWMVPAVIRQNSSVYLSAFWPLIGRPV